MFLYFTAVFGVDFCHQCISMCIVINMILMLYVHAGGMQLKRGREHSGNGFLK